LNNDDPAYPRQEQKMKSISHLQRSILNSFVCVTLTLLALHAYAAGSVDFASGGATAAAPNGTPRTLIKGAQVNAGDTINTGPEGRVHIRFTDGAYSSIQPNTVFKIDTYVFNGRADGNEKGLFSLVKGGLRTVTGAIGRTNRQNYAVDTPAATIGIRGTAYSAFVNEDGLKVSVGQGIVSVINPAGDLSIAAGQTAFVGSRLTTPVMTPEKVLLPRLQAPSAPSEPPPQIVLGDRRDATGSNAGVSMPVIASGNGFFFAFAASDALGEPFYPRSFGNAAVNFDNRGALLNATTVRIDPEDSVFNVSLAGGMAQDVWSDTLIGLGRLTGLVNARIPDDGARQFDRDYQDNQALHYVTGIPTPTANLPNAGTKIDFGLIASTRPTAFFPGQPNTTVLGTVEAGTASIIFGSPQLELASSLKLDVRINIPSPTTASNLMYNLGDGTYQQINSLPTFSSRGASGTCNGSSCSVAYDGFLSGPAAERLGLAYEIKDGVNLVKGALAFRSTGTTPPPISSPLPGGS
jgi:FecR protein